MNKQPIGFIDSGVGGLTVVKEALHQLPAENTIYLGDQARLPYGPRPAEQVQAFTWQMVNFFTHQAYQNAGNCVQYGNGGSITVNQGQIEDPGHRGDQAW